MRITRSDERSTDFADFKKKLKRLHISLTWSINQDAHVDNSIHWNAYCTL